MMDREIIAQTLEYCVKDGCSVCPHNDGDGGCRYVENRNDAIVIEVPIKVIEDALAALKAFRAQEPRMMTIGDLYGNDMGYYERKDEEVVWPVLIARGGPDSDGTVGLVRKDAFEIMADCGLINQTWRIWTAYPTIDQREVAKWK